MKDGDRQSHLAKAFGELSALPKASFLSTGMLITLPVAYPRE